MSKVNAQMYREIQKAPFSNRVRRSVGFTLLELLIALTILAVVVVIVFGALKIGIRAWEKGEADVEVQQRKRVVFDLIKHQISSAAVAKKIESPDEAPFFFKGSPKSLEFQSNIPILPGNIGMVKVLYKIFKNEENGQEFLSFLESETLFSEEKGKKSEAELEKDFNILIPKAREIHFEYLSQGTAQEEPQWIEEWDETKKDELPLAIRIFFQESKDTPPLLVMARIEQRQR